MITKSGRHARRRGSPRVLDEGTDHAVRASAVVGLLIVGASVGMTMAAAQAQSPSGALLQVPVHVPVNVCGNTVSVIGVLNPAFGNTCVGN